MNKKILIVILVVGLIVFSGFVLRSMEKKQKPTVVPQELKPETQKNLSQVKVASLYESVTDGNVINRSMNETAKIFKEIQTDFIFRGFWRWYEVPNNCKQVQSWGLEETCELWGYSYEHLESAINKIKTEKSAMIFTGAVPAQIIQKDNNWNPKTGETISYPETWELALDPGKWSIAVSKKEAQCTYAKMNLWFPQYQDCRFYNPETMSAYYPDITNPKFQEILLSWAERQIDAGADAIWIDMLFFQADALAWLANNDTNHLAAKESYAAASQIVDKIHEYGSSKGKSVYVGTWTDAIFFPYPAPALDFVTISPSVEEVKTMKLDETKWDADLVNIKKKFGNITIFVFFDWATTAQTQMGIFSQTLNKEQQNAFLRTADNFFTKKEVIFIYPVHGGWMGEDAKILSFGKFKFYDSLAPEFQTYETIKELAQNKSKGE